MTTILDLPIEILMHVSTFIKGNLFWKFFRDSNKYFKENLPPRKNQYNVFHAIQNLEKAGYNSYVEIFLRENNFSCSYYRQCKLIKKGYLECFKYFICEKNLEKNYKKFYETAITYKQLHVLEWLSKYKKFPKNEICSSAVNLGNLTILEWAISQGYPMDEKICLEKATKNGNLEILEWMKKNGFSLNRVIYKFAAQKGNLEILEWARKNDCSWHNSIGSIAVKHRHLKILKWIRKNNLRWDVNAYKTAIDYDRQDIINWIKKHNYPYDISTELNDKCPSCSCILDDSDKSRKRACGTCSYNDNDIYCLKCTVHCKYCKKNWCINCNGLQCCGVCGRISCKKCMGPKCMTCEKVNCCHYCMKNFQCQQCFNDSKNKVSKLEFKLGSKIELLSNSKKCHFDRSKYKKKIRNRNRNLRRKNQKLTNKSKNLEN